MLEVLCCTCCEIRTRLTFTLFELHLLRGTSFLLFQFKWIGNFPFYGWDIKHHLRMNLNCSWNYKTTMFIAQSALWLLRNLLSYWKKIRWNQSIAILVNFTIEDHEMIDHAIDWVGHQQMWPDYENLWVTSNFVVQFIKYTARLPA